MTEPERLHRLLDSLRFPPPVDEAAIDALESRVRSSKGPIDLGGRN